MKNSGKIMKEILKRAMTTMVEGDTREWPPTCAFLIYQPERPICDSDTSADPVMKK